MTAHTLRYYERVGLIQPVGRARNGHRRYSEADEAWLNFLHCMRAANMPIRDMQRYAELMGRSLHDSGRRCGLAPVLFNPAWRFVRGYLLRLGFLDGWRGLVFALVEASYVQSKYLQLYMRSRGLSG